MLRARKTLANWEFADRQNIQYREDSSNAKLLYSRNRIRLNVIKEMKELYPTAIEKINRTCSEIGDVFSHVRRDIFERISSYSYLSCDKLGNMSKGLAIENIDIFLRNQILKFDYQQDSVSVDDLDRLGIKRDVVYQIHHQVMSRNDSSHEWSTQLPFYGIAAISGDKVKYLPRKNTAFGTRWCQHRRNLEGSWKIEIVVPAQGSTVVHVPGRYDGYLFAENRLLESASLSLRDKGQDLDETKVEIIAQDSCIGLLRGDDYAQIGAIGNILCHWVKTNVGANPS